MSEHRQLAAIMFADIQGYTALMQQDEILAKEKRDQMRAQLESSLVNNQGEIIQHYGDGCLTIFHSAIVAVQAAVQLQQALNVEDGVPVRIGIHEGDIVQDEEGIYGDAVNLAARIEAKSIAGGILISDRVFYEIKNHPEFQISPMGKFRLKNIRDLVELYAVANHGVNVPDLDEFKALTQEQKASVAVLPFVNMSSDPENEFFSDGITEEILNALARKPSLFVSARTSSFAFKDKQQDVRKIGQQLGVGHVLEGSVRKNGDRVRVTAQLIDARNGYHLFSETYDRDIEDVFAIQDEISDLIARKFDEVLGQADQPKNGKAEISSASTPNAATDAVEYYLRSRALIHNWNPVDARKSIELIDDALRIKPEFAEAHAHKAFTLMFLAVIGQFDIEKAAADAGKHARLALELNNRVPEPYAALAMVELFYHWNWDKAKTFLARAIDINPNDAEVLHLKSMLLMVTGQTEESLECIRRAIQLDPLSLKINLGYGEALLVSRNYEESIAQFSKCLEMDPDARKAIEGIGSAHFLAGRVEEGIEWLERLSAFHSDPDIVNPGLTMIYGLSGHKDKARQNLRHMLRRKDKQAEVSMEMDLAAAYTGLGDKETAIEYLNRAVDKRMGGVIFLRLFPFWDELRGEAGFEELLDRIGVPEMQP